MTAYTYFSLMSLMLGDEVSHDFGMSSPISAASSQGASKAGDILSLDSPFDISLLKEEEDRKYMQQESLRGYPPSSSDMLNLSKAKIKHSGFIPVIFELICSGQDPELHTLLLTDFLRLLQQSADNREVFLQQNSRKRKTSRKHPDGASAWQWKAWLFGLLAHNSRDPSVLTMVIDFFVTLIHHSMLMTGPGVSQDRKKTARNEGGLSVESFLDEDISEKKKEPRKKQVEDGDQVPFGIKNLQETQTLIKYFGENGFFDTINFSKQLHSRLLLPIVNSIKTCPPPLPTPPLAPGASTAYLKDPLLQKIENWLGWFELIEEYLFYSPRMPLSPETR